MPLSNLIKKYLVDSQLFVAVAGTALAVFFMLEQDAFRLPGTVFVFLTYFSGYLYTKYQNHKKSLKRLLILNLICGIICTALILVNHNGIRLFRWAVIVLLGLAYNSFFLDKFIRKVPLLKVFYVGLSWALVNSWLVLPAFDLGIFTVSGLFVTALVLPFDIRDMSDDEIITFPKLIGIKRTKILAIVLVIAADLSAVFALQPDFAKCFFLSSAVAILLIIFSENHRGDAYFSVGVESCSLLPLLFLILMKYF